MMICFGVLARTWLPALSGVEDREKKKIEHSRHAGLEDLQEGGISPNRIPSPQ